MSEHILDMTAYCGLVCSDCIRYRGELTDTARSLLSILEKRDFHHYAAVKMKYEHVFEQYPIFVDVLKAITELECRQSCRKGGGCSSFACPIIECCIEKQYQGCWECEQLDNCDRFDFLKPFHGDTPKNNCNEIHNNGFTNFALIKHPFYVWGK